MRLVVGSVLVVRADLRLWGDPPLNITFTSAVLLLGGILIMLGLWTPIAGIVVALAEAWKILAIPGDKWLWLLLVTIAGALAMLGPLVDRCSPVRVEARRSSPSHKSFELSVTLLNNPRLRSFRLKRGCYPPPKSLRFLSMWGCAQIEPS